MTYRVYFSDGNQKLIEARHLVYLVSYIMYNTDYSTYDITRVEKVD